LRGEGRNFSGFEGSQALPTSPSAIGIFVVGKALGGVIKKLIPITRCKSPDQLLSSPLLITKHFRSSVEYVSPVRTSQRTRLTSSVKLRKFVCRETVSVYCSENAVIEL
jgi:hypothetical protein